MFQVTNSAKEVLVHFENDEHKYWIPEIIAKNITKEQKEKELKKREPAESVTKKVVAPMNIDSLDSLFSGATGAKANVVKKKKIDKQWLEIPVKLSHTFLFFKKTLLLNSHFFPKVTKL